MKEKGHRSDWIYLHSCIQIRDNNVSLKAIVIQRSVHIEQEGGGGHT